MWQAAWLVPPGAGGAGAGGGGKASSCSTHDFLSRYGDGSSLYADHASARGASSLTTQDFLQPLERSGNGSSRSCAFRDSQVPSTSDKTAAGLDTGRDVASALAPAAADRLVPRHNTAYPNPATARANAAMDAASNSMSRKLSEGATVPDSVRPGPFHNSPVLANRDSNRDEHSVLRHSDAAAAADPDSTDFFTRERAENLAYWSSVRLKFGMTDMAFGANMASSHTPLEPSHMPAAVFNKQWQQPVQALNDTCNRRPIKVPSEDDDDEEDDYIDGRSREARKDNLFHKESAQKVDGKSDVRGGTPRSKHSATEQRRRSKINDRFQMLRQLVPHSDQKRDKASFLLEVIEYIQILKDKVKKYENVEHGRHQDRLKSMVWDLCKRSGGAADSSLGLDPSRLDSLVLAKEYSSPVSGVLDIKQSVQSPFARTVGGYPVTSKNEPAVTNPTATISNSSYEREKFNNEASESMQHYPGRGRPYGPGAAGIVGVAAQDPLQQQQQQQVEQRYYGGQGARLAQPDTGHSQVLNEEGGSNLKAFPPSAGADQRQYSPPASYGGPSARQPSPRGVQATANEPSLSVAGRHPPSNTSREPSQQEDSRAPSSAGQDPLAIQGGVINVSSVYSQGLLDTLTKALQSSGLDLSQANISVQIDLGKTTAAVSPKVAQTPESSTQSHQSQEHTRQTVSYPDQDLQTPHKRPKIEVDV